ncbi:hypothetical protein DL93DRAFT_1323547 [Clavulina sp. PMI_390]|nr:hypothetical protein DL93DRAFT_1323547 [Clavulina sp. PMI_390]
MTGLAQRIDTSKASRSPHWLHRVNLDVVFAIISRLDPLSILHLSLTCKIFQGAIGSDPSVWRHVLRDVALGHGPSAPHSYDEFPIRDLKRLSLRPDRLLKAFQDPETALRATIINYKLNYGDVIQSSGRWGGPGIEHLSPRILTGGRWIISGIINAKTHSTQIFCWDRHTQSDISDSPLRPVATFLWEGLKIRSLKQDWVQAQLEGSNDVTLAFSLTGWPKPE